MNEKHSKKQIDIRVTQALDEDLFNYLFSGKGIERVRALFEENVFLKAQNEKLIGEINKYKGELIGIKLSSRQSQKNTDMMLGIFNTWLFHQSQMSPISIQEKKHPVIAFFETEHRKMLDDIKQRGVYDDKPKQETKQDVTFPNFNEDDPF